MAQPIRGMDRLGDISWNEFVDFTNSFRQNDFRQPPPAATWHRRTTTSHKATLS
jgi:hypothetical protein